ncbi:MAG: sulfite exporter TauE/SafE family protein [Xanthomonadales bacterium]|nr:sulfite exporter TauE/SafE family protein [Gammaproteobacteria bacterium]NNK03749.1 sulfite exporter TauE/SafE family protein [Xanthomonadales bacterium]
MSMIWIEYALTGLVAGFLAGYLGIGGGLVLVPVLSWLFSRDPATAGMAVQMAVATSLATMLFTSMSSLLAHHRRGAILWQLVRQMIPGLLAGALLGSFIADRIGNTALGNVFGIFALIVGVQMLRGSTRPHNRPLPGSLPVSATGAVIGTISSLLGIGGGSLTVPWLLWHGQRVQNAIATAAACGYPIAIAGTAGFIFLGETQSSTPALGYVHLQALAGVALFSVLGAPLGVAAVHRSSPLLARRFFAAFLLVVAVKMLLR